MARILASDPDAGGLLLGKIAEFRPHIIINQARARADAELGYAMKSVCAKYFGVDAVYLGHVDHDNAVWQSLRKRRPLIVEHPYSSIVGQFHAISKNLINPQLIRAVV